MKSVQRSFCESSKLISEMVTVRHSATILIILGSSGAPHCKMQDPDLGPRNGEWVEIISS